MDCAFRPSMRIEDAVPKHKSSKFSKIGDKARSLFNKLTTSKESSRKKCLYAEDVPETSCKAPKSKKMDSKLGYSKKDFIKSPRKSKIEDGLCKKRDYYGVGDLGKVPSVDQKNKQEMPDFSKVEVPGKLKKVNKDYMDEDDTKIPAPEVDQKKMSKCFAPDTSDTTATATKSTAAEKMAETKDTEDEQAPSVLYCSRGAPPSRASGKQRDRIVDVVIEVPCLVPEQEPEVSADLEAPLPCPCHSLFGVLCPTCYKNTCSLFFEESEDEGEGETMDDSMVTEDSGSEYSDRDESESFYDDFNFCPLCDKEMERITEYIVMSESFEDEEQPKMDLLKTSSTVLQSSEENDSSIYMDDDENDGVDSDSLGASVSESDEDAECSEDSESESSGLEDGYDTSDENNEEAGVVESEKVDNEAAGLEVAKDENETAVLEVETTGLEVAKDENETAVLEVEDKDEDLDEDAEVYLDKDGDEDEYSFDDESDILCPSCYSSLFIEALDRMGFRPVWDQRTSMPGGKDTQKAAGAKMSSEDAPAENASAEGTGEDIVDIAKPALADDIDTFIKKDRVFVRHAEKLARKLYGEDIVDFDVQLKFRMPNIHTAFAQTSKMAQYLDPSKSELPKRPDEEEGPTKTKQRVDDGPTKTKQKVDDVASLDKFSDPTKTKQKADDVAKAKQKVDDVASLDKFSDDLEWDYDMEWDLDSDEDSSFDVLSATTETTDTEDTDSAADESLEVPPTSENAEESTTQPEEKVKLTEEDEELLTNLISKDKAFAIKLNNLVRETYGEDSAWEFEATHQIDMERAKQRAQEQEAAAEETTGDADTKRPDVEVESHHENAPEYATFELANGSKKLHIEVESDHDSLEAEVEAVASGSRVRSPSPPEVEVRDARESSDSGLASISGDSHGALDLASGSQDESEEFEVLEGYSPISDYEFVVPEPSSAYASVDQLAELEDRVVLPSPTWTIIVYLFPDIDEIGCYTTPDELDSEDRQSEGGKVNVVYTLKCPVDFRHLMYLMDPDIVENAPPMTKFVLAAKTLSQIVAPRRVRVVFQLPPAAPPHVQACYKDLYRELRRLRAERFQPLEEESNRIYNSGLPALPAESLLSDVRAYCKSALVSLERVGDYLEKAFEPRGPQSSAMNRWYARRAMDHAMAEVIKVMEQAPLPSRVRSLLHHIVQKADETLGLLCAAHTIGLEALTDLRLLALDLMRELAVKLHLRDREAARQNVCMKYLHLVCDGLLRSVFYTPARVKVRCM